MPAIAAALLNAPAALFVIDRQAQGGGKERRRPQSWGMDVRIAIEKKKANGQDLVFELITSINPVCGTFG